MSQIQQLNINLEGIGGVLKGRRFRVPAYQRSYAWEVVMLKHCWTILKRLSITKSVNTF
jgi:hypothetical protein